jgi:hypothetical protein
MLKGRMRRPERKRIRLERKRSTTIKIGTSDES